jgi:MFS family permease
MMDNGLAIAILGAMALMVLAGLLLGYLSSRFLGHRFGWSSGERNGASLIFAALGLGAGLLAITATFYESTWAPPPEVTFAVPQGFSENWVILLEDPSTSQQLEWRGIEVPFFGKSTTIAVPSNGIVRVREIGDLGGRMDITAQWSDGSQTYSLSGGPAPAATKATAFVAFDRNSTTDSRQATPPFGDEAALGDYILKREGGK